MLKKVSRNDERMRRHVRVRTKSAVLLNVPA